MGQSVVKNSRKIFSQASPESVLNNRVTTLENNEYKITYYEIVSGTSGSLTIPTNSTINSDEFGLSGNAILSKIDGSNKPTFESPKTVGDVVVTASLNTTTGAWVASGTYTDATVALIYSIKIKAIYYSTLNYDRIIETVDLAVTKTSDLINDGDDGISHFITLNDLPSNLTLYATNAASDISGYFKLVSSITDPSYNTVAVDIPTGPIVTTNQFIASLATSPNVIVGNPGIFNVTTIGNIQKLSGTGNAEFYFEVWKRVAAGTETLITTSAYTLPVLNTGYAEFSASALWNDGTFLSTDRIVLKYYATRIVTGSDPSYQFQFGGLSPVRTLVPIPLNVTTKVDTIQMAIFSASLSPADATTYYFSRTIPTTTAANHAIKLGYNGNITSVIILIAGNTVSGTTENSSIQFRNITQSTSSLISNTVKTNGSTLSIATQTVTGLNIPFLATDDFCLEFNAATFVTNPTNMAITVYLTIEKTS